LIEAAAGDAIPTAAAGGQPHPLRRELLLRRSLFGRADGGFVFNIQRGSKSSPLRGETAAQRQWVGLREKRLK
jgi:hypothetical protein